MEKPRHCALALSSAQKILNEKVSAKIKASSTPEELYVTEEDVLELEAEMIVELDGGHSGSFVAGRGDT